MARSTAPLRTAGVIWVGSRSALRPAKDCTSDARDADVRERPRHQVEANVMHSRPRTPSDSFHGYSRRRPPSIAVAGAQPGGESALRGFILGVRPPARPRGAPRHATVEPSCAILANAPARSGDLLVHATIDTVDDGEIDLLRPLQTVVCVLDILPALTREDFTKWRGTVSCRFPTDTANTTTTPAATASASGATPRGSTARHMATRVERGVWPALHNTTCRYRLEHARARHAWSHLSTAAQTVATCAVWCLD